MSINQQQIEENFIHDIENDNVDNLKKYIDNCFHINSILRSRHKIWETNCLSILAIACYSGSVNIVKYLLEHNVDVNQIDSLKQRTALHWAVASKHLNIIIMLVDAGAEINVLDRYSVTPLILCAYNGDVNILRYLIKNGANLNLSDRMNLNALDHACLRLNIDTAKELIMNGCKCNTSTPFGLISPLKSLITNKEYELARMLIESDFDIINEKWLLNYINENSDENTTNENKRFVKWLRNYMKNPLSLLNLCRIRLRNELNNDNCYLEQKIQSLHIPIILKEYLMMKN